MPPYTIDFDFTLGFQPPIVQELRQGGYNLIGFRSASGPNQIQAGVPAWFVVPFGNMSSWTQIRYEPQYRLYVFNQAQVAPQTQIEMHDLSDPIGLGSHLTFSPTEWFVPGGFAEMPSDSIGLANDSPPGAPDLTVGLAGLVSTPSGRQYLPFCAFTVRPQNSIIMKPLEQVLLVAAQLNMQPGTVMAELPGPGCKLQFGPGSPNYYPLTIEAGTIAPVSAGGPYVQPVPSGSPVAIVNAPWGD